jgi:hypothetical protein
MVTGVEGADATEVRPSVFVAVTVNVYEVPDVSPLTVMVPEPACSTMPVIPSGFDVAVYLVIVAPPFDVGAVNATSTLFVAVFVAAPITGAPGAPFVATDPEGTDAPEVKPAVFVAVTVNVYEVPAVSPVTSMVPPPACSKVPDPPAGIDVAVYCVMSEPPFNAGAVNETFAVVDPVTVATTFPGTPIVVTDPEGLDAPEERPVVFVAVTVNVYEVPAVRPVTSMDPPPSCSKMPDPPAGLDVAVYLVIVALPFDDGAVNETFAVVDPVTVAAPITGAPGAPITFTDFNDE